MSDDSNLPLAPDRFTGRKLGKYEVLCRLSSGGMSEIFLAFQKGLAGFRKVVVLKQILPDIRGEEDIVRMFLDEAKITAALNHPNIAQVFDLDVQDDELFLCMEFVPGATLIEVARACRMADESIPLGFTLAAVRDTAVALHYAHTFRDPFGRPRQVIHRDVAEKNIMVTYGGVTKLLDFGIAKMQGRESRTAAGKVKGTSGYMSPEQIMGEELDPRSDVFSLGVVLHECFTGMRLFYGKDAEEGMKAAQEGRPLPPSNLNPEVTPELDAVVMKALSRDRKDRFASALELARALERTGSARLWLPEQCGELMQRFFADREQQTRKLLEESSLGESSGDIPLVARRRPELEVNDRGGEYVDVGAQRVLRVDPISALPGSRKGTGSSTFNTTPPSSMVPTKVGAERGSSSGRPSRSEVTVIAPLPSAPSSRTQEVLSRSEAAALSEAVFGPEDTAPRSFDTEDIALPPASPRRIDSMDQIKTQSRASSPPQRPALDEAHEPTDPAMTSLEPPEAVQPGKWKLKITAIIVLCACLGAGLVIWLHFLKKL